MKSRLYALDALRLMAALLVMAHHWHKHTPAQAKALEAFPQWLSWHGGYIGVAAFFTISGFVILESAQGVTARSFVFARIIRLYPAFWVCCTLTYLCCIDTKYSADFAGYVTSMTMFPSAFNHLAVDGVYWTLAVEAKFYLVVAAMLAMGRSDQIAALIVVWMCSGLFVTDATIRVAFSIDWAPYFAAGCACYLLRQDRTAKRWAMLVLSACFAADLASKQAMKHARLYGIDAEPFCLAFAVLAAVCLILAISQGWLSLPRSRVVHAMGAISYPLYLLHAFLGWKMLTTYATDIPSYIGVFAGMMFLAWAVSHFEPRLQGILRKVLTAREIGYTRVSA
jgi:peptidoglycan/LPS O-acetylase OafA/YrhL